MPIKLTPTKENCEHENWTGEGAGVCPDCNMLFVYCHACSLAGGAERAIYHDEPACPHDETGKEST